jgi:hypothetical protein
MLNGGRGPSRQPYVLRWPTEMVASMVALGFGLSLLDHLSRVLRDKPIYSRLALELWIGLAVVAIPFEIWFYYKSHSSSDSPRRARAKGPIYLRLATYVLNLYIVFYPFIRGAHLIEHFHLHWSVNRIDPWANGAFLAIALGNYAAILYGRLENIEESPGSSSSIPGPE